MKFISQILLHVLLSLVSFSASTTDQEDLINFLRSIELDQNRACIFMGDELSDEAIRSMAQNIQALNLQILFSQSLQLLLEERCETIVFAQISISSLAIRNILLRQTSSTENMFLLANDSIVEELKTSLTDHELDSSTTLYIKQKDVIYEMYKPVRASIRTGFVCEASPESPCNPEKGKLQRRSDLSGTTIRAVIEYYPPLAMYDRNDLMIPPWGFFPEVFLELQKILNFSFTLSVSPDGKWGSLSSDDKSFDGMVGMLQRNEADICIGALDITADRARAIDYSIGLVPDGAKIFIQTSGHANLNYTEMLYTFTPDAWKALFLVLLLSTFLFIFHYGSEHGHSWRTFGASNLNYDIANSLALPLRAVIFKGHSRIPKLKSGRIAMIAILFLGTFIFSLYRGGILSKLAVKRLHEPINSMKDILDSGFKLGTIKGTTTQEYFEKAPNGTVGSLLWEQVQENLVSDNTEGINRLKKDPQFALLMYFSIGARSPLYPCQITDIGSKYLSVNEAFGFPKDSPLKDLFNFHLLNLLESGYLTKTLLKWQRNELGARSKNECFQHLSSLGYQELIGIFILLLLGIASSIIMSFLEATMRKVKPRVQVANSLNLFKNEKHIIEDLLHQADALIDYAEEKKKYDLQELKRALLNLKKQMH